MNEFQRISRLIAAHKGGARSLVEKLDARGHRHLSFSKIACVESCPYSYFLQYVKREELDPQPAYFVKGRVFHRAAASFYRRVARGQRPAATDLGTITRRPDDIVAECHLRNAAEVLAQNAFEGWEVLGVEDIFVLDLGRGLPPCVGVIDLVLRQGSTYAVVDHKTGKDFWRQDPMQLAIYREHVLREHGATKVQGYFDAYRWVNDLRRIRKPAFERTRVRLSSRSWAKAQRRFEAGYKAIKEVERAGEKSPGTGSCWMCAWKGVCKKAHDLSWW
ncbi:MAG: PD-(D/E)XK nuclease family protein [Deltaproteobacteria bacterium]|nr:PD-(D/E)XK nuclease family protein [Deltaproteobacteria bacterium]